MCNSPTTPFLGCMRPKADSITMLTIKSKDCRSHSVETMDRLHDHIEQYRASSNVPGQDAGHHVAVDAVYDMLGSPSVKTQTVQSSISIDFSWQEAAELLSVPPSSANATLHIRSVPGDSQSVAHSLHSDLCALTRMEKRSKAFQAAKAEQAAVDTVAWAADASQQCIEAEVQHFIETLSSASAAGSSAGSRATSNVDMESRPEQTLSKRSDLDFSEHLWDFVKVASSYSDLRGAMGKVFRALQNHAFQPTIHRTNSTMIGRVAAQFLTLSRDGCAPPGAPRHDDLRSLLQSMADPIRLLESVVEIGAAKLQRDYSSHLIGEELCTGQQLADFLENAEGSLAERLAKLHNILELFVVTKGYCDIAHSSLRELVGGAMNYYLKQSSKSLPVFVLPLPAFSESALKVKRLCSTAEPRRWSARISDGTDSDSMSVHLSQRPIIIPSDAGGGRKFTSSLMPTTGPSYYQTMSNTRCVKL